MPALIRLDSEVAKSCFFDQRRVVSLWGLLVLSVRLRLSATVLVPGDSEGVRCEEGMRWIHVRESTIQQVRAREAQDQINTTLGSEVSNGNRRSSLNDSILQTETFLQTWESFGDCNSNNRHPETMLALYSVLW